MLGWHISVFRVDGMGRGDRIAVWQAELGGLDWITALIADGKATGGGNGYPMRYLVRATDARDALASPPEVRHRWALGLGDIVLDGWLGRTTIDEAAVAALDDDDLLQVVAWDQS